MDAGGPPAGSASATWDTDSRQAAATTGVAGVAAFIRKDLDPPAWAAGLAGLLSEAARAAYLGDDPQVPWTDPANVPGEQVTGAPVAREGDSPYLAEVQVPTDAGTYSVLLSRDDGGGWLVERYEIPGS
jgi:hypothetical protein